MGEMGKSLLLIGAVIMLIGGAIVLAGRLGFRGLPGDVRVEGEGYRFYFPIVTCVVISIVLTLGAWLFRWFGK